MLPDQLAFDEPFRDTTWTNGWAPCEQRGIVVAPFPPDMTPYLDEAAFSPQDAQGLSVI